MIEKLKVCAEALGYVTTKPISFVGPIGDHIWIIDKGKTVEYDPFTNDAQAFELLKWLADTVPGPHQFGEGGKYFIRLYCDITIHEGQTLNECIINAVWEVKRG